MKLYNLCLHKAYFEKGYSLTSYVKYLIALFGLSSLNVRLTMILGLIYALSCYLIGFVWYYFGFIEAEIEVSNRFNLFVKEVRRKIKKKSTL